MRVLLLLNGLSPTENRVFAAILAVLVCALLVLILIAVRRRSSAAPAAVPPPAPVNRAPAAPSVPVRDERTMDEHYASVHGQWVCPYCETLNDVSLNACRACGQLRFGTGGGNRHVL